MEKTNNETPGMAIANAWKYQGKCIHKFIGNTGFRRTSCGMTQFSIIRKPEYFEGKICPKCWKPITFVGILDEQLRGGKKED